MINRADAMEALFACLDEDAPDKARALDALRRMHPFDLSDFQEGLDELEALIIQVRGEKTVTVEAMEEEGRPGYKRIMMPPFPPPDWNGE